MSNDKGQTKLGQHCIEARKSKIIVAEIEEVVLSLINLHYLNSCLGEGCALRKLFSCLEIRIVTLLKLLLQLLQLLGAEGGPAPAELRPVVVRNTSGLFELGAGLGTNGVDVVPGRGGGQKGGPEGPQGARGSRVCLGSRRREGAVDS